jgi:S1-C subfamily serine protease
VIDGCVRVTLAGEWDLGLIARDVTNDLALLSSHRKAPFVALFGNAAPRPGETVVAFGFPLSGLLSSSGSVTSGTISATAGPQDDSRLIQITAPVQPGNSGGPLLDSSGAVVGVVVSMLDALAIAKVTGEVPQNVNFAIKTAIVRVFLDSNHVAYRVARSTPKQDVPEIARKAQQFTVRVECWQ